MTAPLPLISTPAAANAAPASGRKTTTDKSGASFADVLSRQGPADGKRSLASSSAAKPGNPDELAAVEGDAKTAATLAEAGALAVAAQQIISSTALPEQALALAAQGAGLPGTETGVSAADALNAARGQAQVALATAATGASTLTAALATTAGPATPVAPIALTADQAAALSADVLRQAAAETPVLTNAVKSVVAAVETKTEPAAKHVPELRLTPAIDVPAHAKTEASAKTLPAEEEAELLPSTFASLQMAATPQQAAAAVTDQTSNLAAMVNAAVQRQPLPANNAAALAQPPVPVALQVATPVGATHWGTELGQQLVAMGANGRNGMHTAELRLDPPDLGPLRVTLNLADGIASASFVSAHAAVRHAVETALPQLQQSLAQAGISLGQTSVGEQSAQQEFGAQQQGNGSPRQQAGGQLASGTVDATPSHATVARNANALVDTFA